MISTRMLAMAAVSIAVLVIASPALAFEGGGRKPSEAPLIAWSQHYTGQLNNHKEDANYEGDQEVALWRLPSVSSHDQIVVNWHGLPFSHGSGFPVCMMLAQGINDYSWGSLFNGGSCESPRGFELSGSGTAATQITIQSTDTAGNTYLEFWAYANRTPTSGEQETFPYDFSVEAPRHFLGLALTPKSKVHANGAISGAVTLVDGTPAPDGLPFSLSVTWGSNGIASYAATTVGGRITFPLSLPESAFHQHAVFLVSHGVDATYQAVTGRLAANVTPPVATAAEIACARASQHAHALAKQYKRLIRRTRRAHGLTRAVLRRRAASMKRKLHAARLHAKSVCGAR